MTKGALSEPSDDEVQAWMDRHMAEGHFCNDCLPVRLDVETKIEVLRRSLSWADQANAKPGSLGFGKTDGDGVQVPAKTPPLPRWMPQNRREVGLSILVGANWLLVGLWLGWMFL